MGSRWSWCVIGLTIVAMACGRDAEKRPAATELPVLATVPAFSLTNEKDESFGSDTLIEKVWIADFIFTRCPTTCPIQTASMKRLQEKLRPHPHWADLRLVSFTVDPTYDRPAVLKTYGEAAGADPEHWTFLTGERQAIWSLSADGFKLAAGESAEGDGPLFHSTKFVLVDREGRIRGYYDGVSEEGIDALVQDLNAYSDDLWPAHH